MIRGVTILAIGGGLLAVGPVVAEVQPTPGAADPRVRSVIYRPDEVVEIVGHVGYATTIFFADGERVTSVALGDDIWHVVPERNRLSLKPRSDVQLTNDRQSSEADTNMTVFTDRRTYFFDLKASSHHAPDRMTYAVLFRYPSISEAGGDSATSRRRVRGAQTLSTGTRGTLSRAQAIPVMPGPHDGAGRDRQGRHWGFSWQGAAALRPLNAFDDGRFTYLRFRDGMPLPAVFLAEADGQETIANFHVRGTWVVVHRVTPKIVLRDGSLVGCIFRATGIFK